MDLILVGAMDSYLLGLRRIGRIAVVYVDQTYFFLFASWYLVRLSSKKFMVHLHSYLVVSWSQAALLTAMLSSL